MKRYLSLFCLFFSLLIADQTKPYTDVTLVPFEQMPTDAFGKGISRQYVYGKDVMLARWEFKKGAIVPRHHHVSEQITYILSGAVKVNTPDKEFIVRGGEVLVIPPNVPHQFEALEDTVDLDIFAPPRKDWIKGSDTYLKK